VISLSDEWERLPGMQRLITLDGVIYVHQNPKRRRRRVERVVEASDAGEPAPEWEFEAGDGSAVEAEVAAVAEETGVEAGIDLAPVEWDDAETEGESSPSAEADQETEPAGNTRTIVRTASMAPPPGYALEFGTGRLVRIHSYKGRMTYPSGDWP
jgi:hypothetical protein